MFAELAFVDWVALVVAAVLLAGAAAALVIVLVAASQKRRTTSSEFSSPRELRAGPQPQVKRSSAPNAQVIDLRSPRRSSGVTRAARADRLRRVRPIPDTPPPVPRSTDASVLTLSVPQQAQRRGEPGFSPRQPGFFVDPIGRHELRYWDGERWTEHVKEQGHRFVDPL